ncbi:MAG: transcriptional regulator [Nitrososphaerota archaeon]
MRSPCEKFVLEIMPSVRALIAKELIEKYALSQTEVAKIIGTTRPAISQYLSAKRGSKMIRRLRTHPAVRELISRTASAIIKNGATKESVDNMVCEICRILEHSSGSEKPKNKKED